MKMFLVAVSSVFAMNAFAADAVTTTPAAPAAKPDVATAHPSKKVKAVKKATGAKSATAVAK
jgi:hypothetical protein